jgi:hypothetical protein
VTGASYLFLGKFSTGEAVQLAQDGTIVDGYFLAALGAIISTVIIVTWIAVLWHRFVLLEEGINIIPRWQGAKIGSYFLADLGISFIFVLIMVAFSGLFVAIFFQSIGPIGIQVMIFAIVVPCMVLFFRMATSLPARAIGAEAKMSDTWRMTKGNNLQLLVVSALFMITWGALDFVAQTLLGSGLFAAIVPV